MRLVPSPLLSQRLRYPAMSAALALVGAVLVCACHYDWSEKSAHDAGHQHAIDASTDGGPTDAEVIDCAETETDCDGQCINVHTDPKHCGACTKACDAHQVCAAGKCASGCGSLSTCPEQVCADLTQDIDHCGTCDVQCSRPSHGHATCNGNCSIECDANYRACEGDCFKPDDPLHCGPDCTECDVPPNSKATCDGTACGSACLVSTLSCGASDTACGGWNFESGTVEGFELVTGTSMVNSPKLAVEGKRSLSAAMGSVLKLRVPLCPNAGQTDLSNKTLSARLYLEGAALPVSADNYAQAYVVTNMGEQMVVELDMLQSGSWLSLAGLIDANKLGSLDTTSALVFYVYLSGVGPSGWTGTAYFDDVRLQ